ncbi:MAG: hypothetical protein HW391_327 [Chloroflexi bacterium]|nr:hypothetical protein [Chloroflexota bacterium]
MSMHRRPLGRARLLAALGAVVIVAGCLLRWWSVGGSDGLPALSGNGFEGFSLVVFIIALATVALVTLPYATGRPVGGDRWLVYAVLAAAAWAGFLIRIVDLAGLRVFTFEQPMEVFTRGPGLWVTGIGLVMLARAAYDIWREPGLR